MWLRLRNVEKKRCLPFPLPWEFQTPISISRTPDPFLLPGDPRLLINLPRNWLSKRHGNPLQNSCLENPMDREAWQIVVHWVAESQTWLKRLSTQECTHKHFPRAEPSLKHGRHPWLSIGWDTAIPMHGAQVQSLDGKWRSHMPCREKKKKVWRIEVTGRHIGM